MTEPSAPPEFSLMDLEPDISPPAFSPQNGEHLDVPLDQAVPPPPSYDHVGAPPLPVRPEDDLKRAVRENPYPNAGSSYSSSSSSSLYPTPPLSSSSQQVDVRSFPVNSPQFLTPHYTRSLVARHVEDTYATGTVFGRWTYWWTATTPPPSSSAARRVLTPANVVGPYLSTDAQRVLRANLNGIQSAVIFVSHSQIVREERRFEDRDEPDRHDNASKNRAFVDLGPREVQGDKKKRWREVEQNQGQPGWVSWLTGVSSSSSSSSSDGDIPPTATDCAAFLDPWATLDVKMDEFASVTAPTDTDLADSSAFNTYNNSGWTRAHLRSGNVWTRPVGPSTKEREVRGSSRIIPCTKCRDGGGKPRGWVNCETCHGSGKLTSKDDNGKKKVKTCGTCSGSGRRKCPKCKGATKLRTHVALVIKRTLTTAVKVLTYKPSETHRAPPTQLPSLPRHDETITRTASSESNLRANIVPSAIDAATYTTLHEQGWTAQTYLDTPGPAPWPLPSLFYNPYIDCSNAQLDFPSPPSDDYHTHILGHRARIMQAHVLHTTFSDPVQFHAYVSHEDGEAARVLQVVGLERSWWEWAGAVVAVPRTTGLFVAATAVALRNFAYSMWMGGGAGPSSTDEGRR